MPIAKAIGLNILRKLAPEGLSQRGMIRIARAAGGGYRYQDMLNDTRQLLGRHKYQGAVERLARGRPVPVAWMQEVELAQPVNYKVQGYATFWDEENERYISHHVEFFTNNYADEAGYDSMFYDHFKGTYKGQDMEIIEFKQLGLQHNQGWDY